MPVKTNSGNGFRLGVAMLRTGFPRPLGDIGNPATFPFQTIYRTVPIATVASVVTAAPATDQLVEAMSDAVDHLAAAGVDLVTTSCGFLAPLQETLQLRCAVPVLSSSLLLLPDIRRQAKGAPIGVLTFDSSSLTPRHLGRQSGVSVSIEGLDPDCELARVIREDRPAMDGDRAARDVVECALRLVDRHPGIEAILFECTNFSPYKEQVVTATGRPVFDLTGEILRRAAAHEPLGATAPNA